MTDEPTLFPVGDAVPPPRVADPPRRRGRGATPVARWVWRAPEMNAAGRRDLTFEFRPVADWLGPLTCSAVPTVRDSLVPHLTLFGIAADSACALAADCLCEYFERCGGFRLVNDTIMRLWVQLVRSLAADELCLDGQRALRWAIESKAESLDSPDIGERARKRREFACAVQNFPLVATVWLEKYPAYLRLVEEHKRAARSAARIERQQREAEARVADAATPAIAPLTPPTADAPAAERVRYAVFQALGHQRFVTWLGGAQWFVAETDDLLITVAGRFERDWIRGHYSAQLTAAVQATLGQSSQWGVECSNRAGGAA